MVVATFFHFIPSFTTGYGYGYFIDELYYIACAKRLAWGYIDHPPLAPALLRGSLTLFGESPATLRVLPAVTGGAVAGLTAWLAGHLGGGRFAQVLSAAGVTLAPVLLVFFDVYSMNGFEMLLWLAIATVLVLLIEREEPRLWLAFGAISGLALLNKHTVVLVAFALVAGLALTSHRRLLMSPWLLAGGALAFTLFVPNLLWQIENDFPSLEFYRNATLLKNRELPPLHVLWNQVLVMSPVSLPLWGAGLYLAARRETLRPFVVAYGVLLAYVILSASSRPDRIAGIYPFFFAAGAVFWEEKLRIGGRALALAVLLAGGTPLVPVFVPVLPPELVARYVAFLGLDLQVEAGEGKRAALPQWLADRFGWEELASDVRAIYEGLDPDEKATATILAPSYGHAGALELLGSALPPVVSPHNTYFFWSREHVARLRQGPVISIGYGPSDLGPWFDRVERVGTHRCDYCMTWRNDVPLYLARGGRFTLEDAEKAWERAKHYE